MKIKIKMNKKYEEELLDKLTAVFIHRLSIIPKEMRAKEDIASVLALSAVRIFRSELETIKEPKEVSNE